VCGADSKIVYRRYASLFFIAGADSTDNELITLEIIHRYVEQMDKYYGNVCELDIIFSFTKAYYILDELLLAGELQESSKKNVLRCISQQDALEDMEVRYVVTIFLTSSVFSVRSSRAATLHRADSLPPFEGRGRGHPNHVTLLDIYITHIPRGGDAFQTTTHSIQPLLYILPHLISAYATLSTGWSPSLHGLAGLANGCRPWRLGNGRGSQSPEGSRLHLRELDHATTRRHDERHDTTSAPSRQRQTAVGQSGPRNSYQTNVVAETTRRPLGWIMCIDLESGKPLSSTSKRKDIVISWLFSIWAIDSVALHCAFSRARVRPDWTARFGWLCWPTPALTHSPPKGGDPRQAIAGRPSTSSISQVSKPRERRFESIEGFRCHAIRSIRCDTSRCDEVKRPRDCTTGLDDAWLCGR
jgi:hypothetical protein